MLLEYRVDSEENIYCSDFCVLLEMACECMETGIYKPTAKDIITP